MEVDQLLDEGYPNRLAPGAHSHLPVGVAQVALDGVLGEVEVGGYLAVTEAPGGEHHHRHFPL